MTQTDDTYSISTAAGIVTGCIDLVESHNDDGWYAHEYNFQREDTCTRISNKIYRDRASLIGALKSGTHRWQKWD